MSTSLSVAYEWRRSWRSRSGSTRGSSGRAPESSGLIFHSVGWIASMLTPPRLFVSIEPRRRVGCRGSSLPLQEAGHGAQAAVVGDQGEVEAAGDRLAAVEGERP